MSLLRERAIDVSRESTLSARRPAEARAWLVNRTRSASDDESKLLTDQANVVRGAASSPTDVRMKAIAIIATKRLGSARSAGKPRGGREAASGIIIGGSISCRHRLGSPVSHDPRPRQVVP